MEVRVNGKAQVTVPISALYRGKWFVVSDQGGVFMFISKCAHDKRVTALQYVDQEDSLSVFFFMPDVTVEPIPNPKKIEVTL